MMEMLRLRCGAVVRVGDRVHMRYSGSGGTVAAIDDNDVCIEFDDGEFMWFDIDTCRRILRAGNPPRPKKQSLE